MSSVMDALCSMEVANIAVELDVVVPIDFHSGIGEAVFCSTTVLCSAVVMNGFASPNVFVKIGIDEAVASPIAVVVGYVWLIGIVTRIVCVTTMRSRTGSDALS
jgi:hypothetical protein